MNAERIRAAALRAQYALEFWSKYLEGEQLQPAADAAHILGKLASGEWVLCEKETVIADGWRQCAQGQRTTQFCGMAEEARKAEREACARIIEAQDVDPAFKTRLAAAIRARNAD